MRPDLVLNGITAKAIGLVESGLISDALVRAGIRSLLRSKRKEIRSGDTEYSRQATDRFVRMMNSSPIAMVPELANEQHYEVPAEFFDFVLGPCRKYSCCYWPAGIDALDEAEVMALDATVQRAQISDGMRILELGCGWGALTLWIAERYPNSSVSAVTNSTSQHRFIAEQAERRFLSNIEVTVCDMNEFSTARKFDRIVSVEMFEHMRNYRELFRRINQWLEPDGQFFLHIFCHYSTPYEFVDKGPGDWMSRHFFSGGIMPSEELPLRFSTDLLLGRQWRWNGRHYARTCDAWLNRMDERKSEVLDLFRACYGRDAARLWFQRWRVFFMACGELFRFANGNEWFVSHYLFRRT